MLVSTKGIVLHHIKYAESSVIATIFTEKFGRQSYLINSARSKKTKNKAGMLQALFMVDIVAYQKHSNNVHRIKEIKINTPFQSIPFDIRKSTQAIFIAEILYKTIQEEEGYEELFAFLEHVIQYFDLMEDGTNNFYLFFIIKLLEYLGIYPNTSKIKSHDWFDMEKGGFVAFEPPHPQFINPEITNILKQLMFLKVHELGNINITKSQREMLLSKLLDYYKLHFDPMGKIKSTQVLKEVFG